MTTEQLRTIRGLSHMTIDEFADYIGVSSELISKIERGERRVSERTAALVASAFDLSSVEIMLLTELRRKVDANKRKVAG